MVEPPLASFAAMAPSDRLLPFVTALHLHAGTPAQAPYRRLPGPFAALVVHGGGSGYWRRAEEQAWRPFPRVALQGLFTSWNFALDDPDRRCSMVLIQPAAVETLFHIRAADTVDQVLDLAALRPDLARTLSRIAVGEANPLPALDDVLASIVRRVSRTDLAVPLAMIRREAGSGRVSLAAAVAGRSERSLRRSFQALIGVSPKRWCMIERFSANLRRLHPSPWTDAGAAPDYFDQAHEIREFRGLAGITPGAYRREKQTGDRRMFAYG
jgi:AraC-like DNA-binding protein